MTDQHKHGINTVATQTGLTQLVIRTWEKRYNVVTPLRTETNRRLYSDADISRLTLLRLATEAGHSIGRIVNLQIEDLLDLIGMDGTVERSTAVVKETISEETSLRFYITSCIAAVKQFQVRVLESTLFAASVAFSQPIFLEKLIAPLMQEIGEQWKAGNIRIAHEHLATAVIRTLLGNFSQESDTPSLMPNLVIATPRAQLHEIGALLAATTAASQGWQVTYLGSNLPVEEILGCTIQSKAKAIGLSIIYPTDDPRMTNELQKLRRGLHEDVALFIGGTGAIAYDPIIEAIGAVRVNDLSTFRTKLNDLRAKLNIFEENVTIQK